MAVIPASQIMRLQLFFTKGGNSMSNSFCYSASTTYDYADMVGVATGFSTGPLAKYKLAVSQEIRFGRIEVHGMVPDAKVPYVWPFEEEAGAVAQESVPTNLAAVIQLRQTEVSGRHNGRVMVAGVCETHTEDGLLTTAYANGLLKDLADELLLPITVGGDDFRLVVAEKFTILPPHDYNGYRVTQTTVMRNMATQSRRRIELKGYHG